MINLLEYFIKGKQANPDLCEDGLVLGENLIAVIDGVTAKGTRLWEGKKSGCFAKDIFVNYLKQDVDKQTAEQLFSNLDKLLNESISNVEGTLPYEEFPRASVIVYNDIYKEIWSYGDCQCRINEKIYNHVKKIDELNADLRAYYLEYYLENGMSLQELREDDLGRKAIGKNLIMQYEFENKVGRWGYAVLNGTGIENSMIKKYSVKEGDTIVLASDGYPVLEGTLEQSEAELRNILSNDSMCFRIYRSTKGVSKGNESFDDRVYCRFKIGYSCKV